MDSADQQLNTPPNSVDSVYAMAFMAMDQGFCLLEKVDTLPDQPTDFRYLLVNPAFEKHTGLQQVVGKTIRQVVSQVEESTMAVYEQVALTGEPSQFQAYVALLDSWIEANAFRTSHHPAQLAVVFTNITDRKRAEQHQAFLSDISKELVGLTSIADTMEQLGQKIGGYFGMRWCMFSELVHDNELAVVSYGWSAEDVVSLKGTYRMRDFLTDEQLARHNAGQFTIVDDVQTDGRVSAETYGALGIRSFIIVPIARQQQWTFLLSIIDDKPRQWHSDEVALMGELTDRIWTRLERARAEEALRHSEQRLQLALEGASIFTWEVTPETGITQYSANFNQALGFDLSSIAEENFIHNHPEDQDFVTQAFGQALRGEGPLDIEHRIILPQTGALIWVRAQGQLTQRSADASPVLIGITQNITVRKEAEEALKQANRRKDEFLAMLAHELRNPMATLRSGLQILTLISSEDELTASTVTASTVAMMNRQTDHLVRLVDDLLDVSRISQGKIDLKTARMDLVELVKQAAESVRAFYQEQGRTLQIDLPTTPIYVAGDTTRLSQVVTNLLTNGVRYTGERGQVWLSLAHHRQEALLAVRDNGLGLAPDQLSAIFELFVQVDNSVARSKGGLGVGLTLVKRLVEMHGGRVEAQSEGLGKGSTFRVHLPTLETAPEAVTMPVEVATSQTTSGRILVIDDNADAALTLSLLLKLKGYEAHTRTSGRAGIEAAERLQPGAILLDLGMPEMDGYETYQAIRQQPWGQAVAVVALSGYGQQEDRQRTQAAGFDGHLVKPVDLVGLMNLLTNLLKKGSSTDKAD